MQDRLGVRAVAATLLSDVGVALQGTFGQLDLLLLIDLLPLLLSLASNM